MTTPPDPQQLAQRAREQRAKEAAEDAAQREREAVEARANQMYHAVVEHLKRSGASYTPAELAAELGLDNELDALRQALARGRRKGTVMESQGHYRAAQRGSMNG